MLFIVVVVGKYPYIGTYIHAAVVKALVAVAVVSGNFGAEVRVAEGNGIAFVLQTEIENVGVAIDIEFRVGVPTALNEIVVVGTG